MACSAHLQVEETVVIKYKEVTELSRREVLEQSPDKRAYWLEQVLVLARRRQLPALALFKILINPDFYRDVDDQLGRRIQDLLMADLCIFSEEQQRRIRSEVTRRFSTRICDKLGHRLSKNELTRSRSRSRSGDNDSASASSTARRRTGWDTDAGAGIVNVPAPISAIHGPASGAMSAATSEVNKSGLGYRRIALPRAMIAALIGPAGTNIQRIRTMFPRTLVKVDHPKGLSEGTGTVTINGHPDFVKMVETEVWRTLHETMPGVNVSAFAKLNV